MIPRPASPQTPRRGALERLFALGRPSWVVALRPAPREIAPGLWSVDRALGGTLGPQFPTRSLLVELPGGGLLVWSPVPLDDALLEFVRARGGARFLVAPNSFHHLGLAEWKRAFPEAALWLALGLRARCPALPAGEELANEAPTPFAASFAHRALDSGRGLSEVAFLHAPSRTLVLVDACFNLQQLPRAIDRIAARLLGVWRRFGATPTARRFLLRNRAAVTAWVEQLCEWEFSRIVMAHGDVLTAGPAELRAVFVEVGGVDA